MLSGKAAIVGIGATEFSKDSGRSELRLAAEAVRAALADAGLRPSDVDGLVTFTMDTNAEVAVAREIGVRRADLLQPGRLRRRRRLRDRPAGRDGGRDRRRRGRGLLPRAQRALRAPVRPGLAGCRQRRPRRASTTAGTTRWAWPRRPHGGHGRPALHARVRRHQRGLRPGGRGRTGVTPPPTRTPGSTAARSRSPTTRPRAGSPNRCGCSTAARRATARWRRRDLRSNGPATCRTPPALIPAAAQGSGPDQYVMTSYYRDDLTGLPEMGVVGRQLWAAVGLRRRPTCDVAVLYDHFTPYVLHAAGGAGLLRPRARPGVLRGATERRCRSTRTAASWARPTSTA